ncbi:SDR family oxidoreductase [Plantibacter sp. YIM 135347]|uniref:SDR family oxidoreductase n=1 Tax=Plantibacter sp. YIM 135347 TaxID=3423919 RepID=UPI003D34D7C4
MTILVTGSSGQLGRPTIEALRAVGHDARGLTRSGGPGAVAVDLATGHGLAAALDGVDTVVHAATSNGSKDIDLARRLVAAAEQAGVGHLVLISIVGIDRIPLGFYRDRLRIEQLVQGSRVPVTIQRATQFHSFVERFFTAQRFSPVIVSPRWRFQPIAVEEVGVRLAELAVGAPRGMVEDIGGPEQLTARELHAMWRRATGGRRAFVDFRLPGKLSAAYDAGADLVPGAPYGTGTFEEYLQETTRR